MINDLNGGYTAAFFQSLFRLSTEATAPGSVLTPKLPGGHSLSSAKVISN